MPTSHGSLLAAYELGESAQDLQQHLRFHWMASRDTDRFPSRHARLVDRLKLLAEESADSTQKSKKAAESFSIALQAGWERFRKAWHGRRHLRMIEFLANSEPELVPDTWFERYSPEKTRTWKECREELERFLQSVHADVRFAFNLGWVGSCPRSAGKAMPENNGKVWMTLAH